MAKVTDAQKVKIQDLIETVVRYGRRGYDMTSIVEDFTPQFIAIVDPPQPTLCDICEGTITELDKTQCPHCGTVWSK